MALALSTLMAPPSNKCTQSKQTMFPRPPGPQYYFQNNFETSTKLTDFSPNKNKAPLSL